MSIGPSDCSSAVERVVLRPPMLAGFEVELFASIPSGSPVRRPGVLLVHGHQWPERPGARVFWELSREEQSKGFVTAFERFNASGLVAAAVSQPGYGGSDGPSDFCGPRTQLAIRAALGHLRCLAHVDPERVALYGTSRGATASAMVATMEPDLRALVLIGGIYDLARAYPTGLAGLDANIEREVGKSAEAFAARSALSHAGMIRSKTMILHGLSDKVSAKEQAEELTKALNRNGNPAELRLFDTGHVIAAPAAWSEALPFLQSALY